MKSRFIVNGDFLAGLDVTQGYEKNMVIENLHVAVGVTGVVNVVRAVATCAAIETPAIIDRADAQPAAAGPPLSFSV